MKSSDNKDDLVRYLTKKDEKADIQMKVTASIYDVKIVRLVTVLAIANINTDYELFGEERVEYTDDFIESNKKRLIEKYLRNVLFPYLLQEFGVTFSKSEAQVFRSWFKAKCEEWVSEFKHTTKSEMVELGFGRRNHWKCRRIKMFDGRCES